MRPRQKKLIGLAALLPYLAAYVTAATILADFVPDHWALELAYFAVAGTAWAFPLRRLMTWMSAEPVRGGEPEA